MIASSPQPDLSVTLQEFFTQRLMTQRGASPRTVASYRDAFRLLLTFAQGRLKRSPTTMSVVDLDADLVLAFLDHLERGRGNSARSRNARLAAIRSFVRYASLQEPGSLLIAQRVLAIPMKRFDRPMMGFLTLEEMQAVLAAPDGAAWTGMRDRVLLATLYNTGARVSEIIGLRCADLQLDRSSSVHLRGKGRKERAVPLWRSTAASLRKWLPNIVQSPEAPLFPNRAGKPLTRSGVEHRLDLAVETAQNTCDSLKGRRISPHTIRHTTAMHLLQSGVDVSVIALWLGHEDPSTTHHYVEADLAMKERALMKVREPRTQSVRYRPNDRLLAFLESL
jgi:integrase/recombinase XerD